MINLGGKYINRSSTGDKGEKSKRRQTRRRKIGTELAWRT